MIGSTLLAKTIGFLGILLLAAPGCASTPPAAEELTVEGRVEARGAEPFSAYVLDTDAGGSYVLVIPEDQREGFDTPIRVRATGTLYRADWQGMPYAHLRVRSWERIGEWDAGSR